MPAVSDRSSCLPSSPIRKLSAYANNAKKKGIKVYHLNIGQPDIDTLPSLIQEIKKTDIKILDYSPSEGIEEFRHKLSEYYSYYNLDIPASNIITTIGASEALFIAFSVCLNEGEEIIIPEPSYANYYSYAFLNKCVVKPINTFIDNNFALPSFSEFEKIITKQTKAILISNPNNPTGYVYKPEEMEYLKQLALKYNLFIISDEAYREFCYDDATSISIMSIDDIDDHAILIDSMSKRYSACGARLGMLITKNKKVYDNALKYAQMRLSPPTLEQIAASKAISKDNFEYLKSVNKLYTSRRNLIVELLQEIPGVICHKPQGAFYVTVELPIDDSDKFCKWLLEHFSYNKSTVMLAPGSGFYLDPIKGKKQVRIAYVLKEDDIINAITCLKEALKVY